MQLSTSFEIIKIEPLLRKLWSFTVGHFFPYPLEYPLASLCENYVLAKIQCYIVLQ